MDKDIDPALIDDFFQALSLTQLEKCTAIVQSLHELGESSPVHTCWCLYFSGILANERDRDWVAAERLFRTLLEMELPPSLQGRVRIALARTYDYLGRAAEAIDIYQQCLSLLPQSDPSIEHIKIWKNIAISMERGFNTQALDQSILNEAIDYCQLALDALQNLPTRAENVVWLEATTWNTLGVIHRDLGNWAQAIDCYQHFLTFSKALNDRHSIGMANNNLGEMLQHQGPEKWPEAEHAYQQALDIYREFGDVYEQIDTLSNLGSLYQEMGDWEAALSHYEQAVMAAESIRAQLTAPTSKADFRTTIETVYLAPLSIHLKQGHVAEAITAAERARARVLVDLLATQSPQPQIEIPAALLTQRRSLRQMLDQAYADSIAAPNLADLEAALAQVDRQIDLLDPAYAGLRTVTALTASDIQARLPADAAMLMYFGDADDQLWASVITPTKVHLIPVAKLSIPWLRNFLASHLDGTRNGLIPHPKTGHLSTARLFPSMYQAFVKPVLSYLEAVQTIYIIPFDSLHYLPLGALTPQTDIPSPLLAAGKRIIYCPSATVLFNYCHARRQSGKRGVITLAPKDKNLRFTSGAAQQIATLDPHNHALIDHHASREVFLQQAGQYQMICFLGHAYFDQTHPMSSRLKLANGSLHASEILRELRLEADLVLLPACETGRSAVLRGDEILGLTRAMLYAGTPSVLVTLWPVHEIPTRLLVEKLLGLLLTNPAFDPASVLAEVQCWLRNLSFAEAESILDTWADLPASEIKHHLTLLWQMTHPETIPTANSFLFTHPFFWSPYILVGEGRVDKAKT